LQTRVFDLEHLKAGTKIMGPAIILNSTSTVLIEPHCICKIDNYGNIEINLPESD
jgi:5-oxoprolinase (ATP-hydrolysing)